MSEIQKKRLRANRDRILNYIYENGAGSPHFMVGIQDVQEALELTDAEFSSAMNLLGSQQLLAQPVVGMVGLSSLGQFEAEELGTSVPMQDPPPPSAIHINANYSVVQVGGASSVQHASLSLNESETIELLNQALAELRKLPLDEASRAEAEGLAKDLKEAKLGPIRRAGAAALSAILTSGGSALGHRIADAFRIGLG